MLDSFQKWVGEPTGSDEPNNTATGYIWAGAGIICGAVSFLSCAIAAALSGTPSGDVAENSMKMPLVWLFVLSMVAAFYCFAFCAAEYRDHYNSKFLRKSYDAIQAQTPHGNAQFATAEDLRRGGYIE